jgi:midasin
VLLAVDDSRSMASTGAAGFALQALALLTTAMSRLDVGEVGVLSYGGGGGVHALAPLGTPFSDSAGPAIMSALRFDQDNTISDTPTLALVQEAAELLEGARARAASSSGSRELRQLLLIVGDGRFHEKEALHGAVRALVETQGVCPVFIALDAASASSGAAAGAGPGNANTSTGTARGSSLLDMQSVRFVGGRPVLERYLDSFPFPFYIVLRDIAALPATLADLLRQWFELNAAAA